MSFSKQIGPLVISEESGIAKISMTVDQSAGSGELVGLAKLSVVASASVDAKILVNALLDMVSNKFPLASSEIAAIKVFIDAEISKA